MTTFTEELIPQFVDDTEEPIIIDRSTLERDANCPQLAFHVRHKTVSNNSRDADSGNEVHRITSEAVKLRHQTGAPPRTIREYIDTAAVKSRPDVQPAVIAGLKRGGSMITQLLCYQSEGQERHPDDLLCYDGGEGEFSGQVSGTILPADGTRGPVILTTELDLMLATASDKEVEVIDWKSGWKWWTATEVKDSFQFQFQAWCVFTRFPSLEKVTTRVAMTREGQMTSEVYFDRQDLHAIHHRLLSAVKLHLEYRHAKEAKDVPAWPLPDKCAICPCASKCDLACGEVVDLPLNPQLYLQQYVAADARASEMKANLTAFVKSQGTDLESGSIAFGVNRPRTEKAKTMDYYDIPSGETPAVKPRKRKAVSTESAGQQPDAPYVPASGDTSTPSSVSTPTPTAAPADVELRKCDGWCEKEHPTNELNPLSGDQWYCNECLDLVNAEANQLAAEKQPEQKPDPEPLPMTPETYKATIIQLFTQKGLTKEAAESAIGRAAMHMKKKGKENLWTREEMAEWLSAAMNGRGFFIALSEPTP